MNYVVVSVLEDVGLREPFRKWPLHLTLSPIFEWEDREDVLIERLKDIAGSYPPIDIKFDRLSMFGPKRDVPVLEVEENSHLHALHHDIYGVVGGSNAEGDNYWMDNYHPHSTIRNPRKAELVAVGDTLTVGSFGLFKYLNMRDKTKVLTSDFALKPN